VLRCFPHCCPDHSESPFCASSLAVAITGSLDLLQQCVVLFHFEASYEPAIACGDVLVEETVEASLRTEKNPRGEWIPTQAVSIENDHVIYEYNAESQGGWNYRWLGGSSTQQRRCWHCIKAYVFVRIQHDHQSLLRAIAIVRSPPFVVMSYRRACKSCQKKTTADPVLSSTHREACECEGIYRLSDSHLDAIIAGGASQVSLLPELTNQTSHASPVHLASAVVVDEQPQSLALQEKERRLSLLYLAWTNGTTSAAAVTQLCRGASQLLPPSTSLTENAAWPSALDSKHPLEGSCVDILLALLRDREESDSFLRRRAGSILDQHKLCTLYEEWVGRVYEKAHAALMAQHTTPSAYFNSLLLACRQFGNPAPAKESKGSETVKQTTSASFEAFVAQLREIYLAAENPPSKPLKPRSAPVSAFDGTWCYDPDPLQLLDALVSAASLLTVFRAITMGLCCQLATTSDGLIIRSEVALFSTIASEFVLDGRARVLRVFPNGESTMTECAGLMYGDYVGSLQSPTCIRLDLYCWPVESHATRPRPCYAIQLILQATPTNGRVECHCHVYVCDDTAEGDAWNMAAGDRIQLFQRHGAKKIVGFVATYRRA
ncbi:hypothetical protein As57867_003127, partial [Aphanomyces stellatus]